MGKQKKDLPNDTNGHKWFLTEVEYHQRKKLSFYLLIGYTRDLVQLHVMTSRKSCRFFGNGFTLSLKQ